jgi:pyridoxal 5'-phosphate synthase pdxS subunit
MATTHYNDPDMVCKASEGLGDPMPGLEMSEIPEEQIMQKRGW